MERWRRGWEQIGGRNAVTVWSWILTIPLTLVVSSTYAGSPSLREVLTWQSIVLGVHVILGGAMWVAVMTVLPHTERRSRPITAVLFFGSLGLARALLLQWAQDVVGISGGVFSERLAVNIVGAVVALSVIAIIVDDYRTNEAIVQRLESARATLEKLRVEEQAALRAADIEILAQVQEMVERELARAGNDSARFRAIADDMVRPISHQLAQATSSSPTLNDEGTDRRATLTFKEAFGDMKAPPPLAVAAIVEATILGAVYVRFGPWVAVANLLLGGGLVLVGCWLVRRYLRLPRAPWGRLGVLVIALGLVGATGAAITTRAISNFIAAFPAGVVGVAGAVAGAGVGLSLWIAVNDGRQRRQEELALMVGEKAGEVERLSTLIHTRRIQAARFLHGPIQGELVAAALRSDTPEEVRASVAARFSEYDTGSESPADVQVRQVLESWSTVLDIECHAEPTMWSTLAGDSRRLALLLDALGEGLTNVVRHASLRRVSVTMDVVNLNVRLRVRSYGSAASSRDHGIGLDQLRARGAHVSLESGSDFTELCVVL